MFLLRTCLAAACTLGILASVPLQACTTAVISGKATPDGRPILWKNRDSSELHNQVVRCEDGRYPYLGIVNAGDPCGLQIWSGVNGAGFAIMNNASYNLETKGEESTQEGAFMKLALQSCATVGDFQALLERSGGSARFVAANFGVIDAQGGAAYFETDARSFHRFDAATAPGGFLVRGNYSHSGRKGEGAGYLREARALDLVGGLQAQGRLGVETLLAEVCRDTANAHIGSFPGPATQGFAYLGDSINRNLTTSTFVVQGVLPGEAPGRTTTWVILGQPVTGVAVPLWVEAGAVPPELSSGEARVPLHAVCDRVRLYAYPDHQDDCIRYLDCPRLYAPGKGLLQPFLALEKDNLRHVRHALEATPSDLKTLQADLARRTLERVTALLQERGIPGP